MLGFTKFEYIASAISVILALLIAICIRQIMRIRAEKRQGLLGAKFQLKVAFVFLALVAVPTVFVSGVTILFLKSSMNLWFNKRVKTAIKESRKVAEAYLEEHRKVMEYSIRNMAFGLDRAFNEIIAENQSLLNNPGLFISMHQKELDSVLTMQTQLGSISEAIIIMIHDGRKEIIAKSNMSLSLEFKPISDKELHDAKKNGICLSLSADKDKVFATIPIFEQLDAYLLVSKHVDPLVLSRVEQSRDATSEYEALLSMQDTFTAQIAIMVIELILFIAITAILIGLIISRKVISPIGSLINAAESIKSGNIQVIQHKKNDAILELFELISVFNEMVCEMEKQKQDLLRSNKKLTDRTAFIESVLANISSGVISIQKDGTISLATAQAMHMLQHKAKIVGKNIDQIATEFTPVFISATTHLGEFQEKQIERLGRIFNVSALAKSPDKEIVMTFDEISDLITAERKAAWSDVARRVAHEIKNPLTPIALSAERLKRKYGPQFLDDNIFQQSLQTITKQVEYIGKLVSEFASFARMPSPSMKISNIRDPIEQAIFMGKNTYPNIIFHSDLIDCTINFDAQQINQAFINIIKNAAEAIGKQNGEINISMLNKKDNIEISIKDTGTGLASDMLIIEPYKSTKESGSGLGLSIVSKIIEDHGGTFYIKNRGDQIGAVVVINLPKNG